jgi:hypothetical protein
MRSALWAFAILGLTEDADERAIKRAYASKLKTTRPDQDPEGFQRLHQAYQAALDALRWRQALDAAKHGDADDEHRDDTAHAMQHEVSESGTTDRNVADGAAFENDGISDDSTTDNGITYNSIEYEHIANRYIAYHAITNEDLAHERYKNAAAGDIDPGFSGEGFTDEAFTDKDHEEVPTPQWPAKTDADSDARIASSQRPVELPPTERQSAQRQPAQPPPLPPARPPIRLGLSETPTEPRLQDPTALAGACVTEALVHDPAALSVWLQAKPEFWSLPLKARTAEVLFVTLEKDPSPMRPENLEHLLAFFGLDDVAGKIDGYRLDRLRRQTQQAWLLRGPSDGARPTIGHRIASELERPYRPLTAILRGMIPGRPAAVGRLLTALQIGPVGSHRMLPPQFDPAQVVFWQAAANPARVGWERLAIDFGRVLVVSLLLALLGTFAMNGLSLASSEAPALRFGAWPLIAPIGIALLYTLGRSYLAWYPSDGWRYGWVFATLVPSLVAAALWLDNGLAQSTAAIGVNFIAVALTTLRWRRYAVDGGYRYQFRWWHLLAAVPTLKVLAVVTFAVVLIVEIGAIVVGVAWAFEAIIFARAWYRWRR